jgi:hypothetical protein
MSGPSLHDHPLPNLLGDPRGASRAEDLEDAERERYYGVNGQQDL